MFGLDPVYPLHQGNKLVFSCLRSFHAGPCSTDSVSIKYAAQGMEMYETGGVCYRVGEGECLIIGQGEKFETWVSSRQPVTGLCIDIHPSILSDVYSNIVSSDRELLDHQLTSFPFYPDLTYKSLNGVLGSRLQLVARQCMKSKFAITDTCFFYSIAEDLIRTQSPKLSASCNLPTKKAATRRELYKRLLLAKQYMDDSFSENPTIEHLATLSCLSPFHLIRSFRQAFGLSPHKYLVRKKLEFAKTLLRENRSVSHAAFAAGFSTAGAFIKMYKKEWGCTPAAGRKCGK